MNVSATDLSSEADDLRAAGQSVMFVVVDGKAAGLIGVADPIKPSTQEAVKLLHAAASRVAANRRTRRRLSLLVPRNARNMLRVWAKMMKDVNLLHRFLARE
jgi:hypothetical protein